MNNTFVSVEGVLRGRRGLNTVSENQKIAILQQVFLPNIYLPESPRKPTAERHMLLSKKNG